LIDSHDRLAHGSFVAFRDFELWNAWYRVWALGSFYSSLRFRRAYVQYRRTHDRRLLDQLENHEHWGTPVPEMAEYQDLFRSAYAIMLEVEADRLSAPAAVVQLYALYKSQPWIPPGYRLDDPARRFATPGDLRALAQNSYWGYRRAPVEVRRRYFDFPPLEIAKDVLREVVVELRWLTRLRDGTRYPRFDHYQSASTQKMGPRLVRVPSRSSGSQSANTLHGVHAPMKDMPAQAMPMKDMPAQAMPMKDMPAQAMPMKDVPAQVALMMNDMSAEASSSKPRSNDAPGMVATERTMAASNGHGEAIVQGK
jgi:hypothetical protein